MVELLHTNKQESLDANKAFKKSFVTDNVVSQMVTYIGPSLKEIILDDCMISDEAVIKISKNCTNLVHLSLKRTAFSLLFTLCSSANVMLSFKKAVSTYLTTPLDIFLI